MLHRALNNRADPKHGWLAANDADADRLFLLYTPTYVALFRRSRDQFLSFVETIRAGRRWR